MTDLQMLRQLLSLPQGRLNSGEQRAFHGMYDDLITGKIIGLSKKQRLWVQETFLGHRLDSKPVPLKKIRPRDKVRKPIDFGPLPKKPPGLC
jgi:hypothetical protein